MAEIKKELEESQYIEYYPKIKYLGQKVESFLKRQIKVFQLIYGGFTFSIGVNLMFKVQGSNGDDTAKIFWASISWVVFSLVYAGLFVLEHWDNADILKKEGIEKKEELQFRWIEKTQDHIIDNVLPKLEPTKALEFIEKVGSIFRLISLDEIDNRLVTMLKMFTDTKILFANINKNNPLKTTGRLPLNKPKSAENMEAAIDRNIPKEIIVDPSFDELNELNLDENN